MSRLRKEPSSCPAVYPPMRNFFSFLPFLAAVAAVGAFGAWFEPGEWYAALEKPAWTPPGWVFGPVWTVLYVLIAVAGWLVWRAVGMGATLAAWIVQLVFNGAWSFAMFGAQQIGLAMIIIVMLWLAILAFMVLARLVSRTATLLFVPYLAWVTYAAILNIRIWQLN